MKIIAISKMLGMEWRNEQNGRSEGFSNGCRMRPSNPICMKYGQDVSEWFGNTQLLNIFQGRCFRRGPGLSNLKMRKNKFFALSNPDFEPKNFFLGFEKIPLVGKMGLGTAMVTTIIQVNPIFAFFSILTLLKKGTCSSSFSKSYIKNKYIFGN